MGRWDRPEGVAPGGRRQSPGLRAGLRIGSGGPEDRLSRNWRRALPSGTTARLYCLYRPFLPHPLAPGMSETLDAATSNGASGDLDTLETREWLEALDAVLAHDGPDRARELLTRVVERAQHAGTGLIGSLHK